MSASLHGNCPLMLSSSMATAHNHAVIQERMKQHKERMNQILYETTKKEIVDAQSSDSPASRQHGKVVIDKQDGTDGLWSKLMRKWI
jgi:hypothetical protein